jgi:tetratricopeptide (TPR) repeat protein
MVGRWKDAVDMLEQSLVLEPAHFWSHLVLGELLADHDAPQEAVAHYQAALEHTDEPHPVYVRLAELFVSLRRFEEAETCLQQACDIRPLPEIYYNLGWLTAAIGRSPTEVVALFSAAEKARPQFEHALFNLALAQSADGAFEASVTTMGRYIHDFVKKPGPETAQLYELLREVNPDNIASMLEIAKLYTLASRTQQAIDVLKQLLELKPNFTMGAVMLAETYRNMGRYKDSIQAYRQLIQYEPENIRGYLGLAKSFGAIGNFAAALPVIKKVLELDPHNTEIHYQYATLMAQQGKLTTAYKHYRIVSQLDANYPHIKKRMRMLEEELEDASKSAEQIWPVIKRSEDRGG